MIVAIAKLNASLHRPEYLGREEHDSLMRSCRKDEGIQVDFLNNGNNELRLISFNSR